MLIAIDLFSQTHTHPNFSLCALCKDKPFLHWQEDMMDDVTMLKIYVAASFFEGPIVKTDPFIVALLLGTG